MKKLISLLLVLAMVMTFAACSGDTSNSGTAVDEASSGNNSASSETVTITWAINETANLTREQYMVIKDAFEDAYPNIKVELQLFSNDEKDFVTQIAAGTLADVSHNMADLANLEGVWAEVPAELQAKWDEQYLFTANGVVNAVPVCGQGHYSVIYRKADFEALGLEEPKTWDEFLAVCDAFVANGTAPSWAGVPVTQTSSAKPGPW